MSSHLSNKHFIYNEEIYNVDNVINNILHKTFDSYTFKSIWNFLDELSGVIAAVAIIFHLLKFAIEYLLKVSPFLLAAFIPVIFLILIFTYLKIKKILALFSEMNDREKIRDYLKTYEVKALTNVLHERHIPDTKILAKMGSRLDSLSKKWDSNSTLCSSFFHMQFWNKKYEFSYNTYYYSELKGTQLNLSINSKGDVTSTIYDYRCRRIDKHIYVLNQRWQEAILETYKYIEDRINCDWDLEVHSSCDTLKVSYCFTEGSVNKEESFTIVGNEIMDYDNKRCIMRF